MGEYPCLEGSGRGVEHGDDVIMTQIDTFDGDIDPVLSLVGSDATLDVVSVEQMRLLVHSLSVPLSAPSHLEVTSRVVDDETDDETDDDEGVKHPSIDIDISKLFTATLTNSHGDIATAPSSLGPSRGRFIVTAPSSLGPGRGPAPALVEYPVDPAPALVEYPVGPALALVEYPVDPAPALVEYPVDPAPALVEYPVDPAPALVEYPVGPALALVESEPLQGYPESPPDRLTESEIQQIRDIISASLESLDSSAWENIATDAQKAWENIATDAQTQKAIDSICAVVFPPIAFPPIAFLPQIPTSSPLPDADWQRFKQGDSLAAELLRSIVAASPETVNILDQIRSRSGQEASRLDDSLDRTRHDRLDRTRLLRAREAFTLVTGSTDFIEATSSPSTPTAIVLSYPPQAKSSRSDPTPRPDPNPTLRPDPISHTTSASYPSILDSDAWTAQLLRAQEWDVDAPFITDIWPVKMPIPFAADKDKKPNTEEFFVRSVFDKERAAREDSNTDGHDSPTYTLHSRWRSIVGQAILSRYSIHMIQELRLNRPTLTVYGGYYAEKAFYYAKDADADRFYTPIHTVVGKSINLFVPHPSRMAQKLDPESKLTAAVQLDAAFSLIKALANKNEISEHADFEHCRRAVNHGLGLPPNGGRPLHLRIFKGDLKRMKKPDKDRHDPALIAARRGKTAALAKMTPEEKAARKKHMNEVARQKRLATRPPSEEGKQRKRQRDAAYQLKRRRDPKNKEKIQASEARRRQRVRDNPALVARRRGYDKVNNEKRRVKKAKAMAEANGGTKDRGQRDNDDFEQHDSAFVATHREQEVALVEMSPEERAARKHNENMQRQREKRAAMSQEERETVKARNRERYHEASSKPDVVAKRRLKAQRRRERYHEASSNPDVVAERRLKQQKRLERIHADPVLGAKMKEYDQQRRERIRADPVLHAEMKERDKRRYELKKAKGGSTGRASKGRAKSGAKGKAKATAESATQGETADGNVTDRAQNDRKGKKRDTGSN